MIGTAARLCWVGTMLVLLGACGDITTTIPAAPASIAVSNLTSGDPIQLQEYTVSLDGGPARSLGVNGSILLSQLEAGDHTLELSGIAVDCAVNGINPRTVHTTAGTTAQSLFIVDCSVAGTGRIQVQTFTYGTELDGYNVELDIGRSEPIGTKDELTFYAVPAGPVTITLTGVAANCHVASPNPRTIRLPEGVLVFSIFKIRCTG